MDADLINKILELKKKRNAIILAHNYRAGDIQDIANYVGDSLGLSQQAAKTGAQVINLAGKVVGTGEMLKNAKQSSAKEFIVGTENGLLYRLRKENPDKKFYGAADLPKFSR